MAESPANYPTSSSVQTSTGAEDGGVQTAAVAEEQASRSLEQAGDDADSRRSITQHCRARTGISEACADNALKAQL